MSLFVFNWNLSIIFLAQSIYDWDEPGIGRSLSYMLGTAMTFFFILWVIEYRIIPRLMGLIYGYFQRAFPSVIASDEIDNDVRDEKNKVLSMSQYDLQAESLVLRNVTKFYADFLAVKELCVAVKRCEFSINLFRILFWKAIKAIVLIVIFFSCFETELSVSVCLE